MLEKYEQDVSSSAFAKERIVVVEIASPWRRIGAVLINMIAWVLLWVIVQFLVIKEAKALDLAFNIKVIMGCLPFVLFGIGQLVAYCRTGQTLGKRLLGIKVIKTNGYSTGFMRLLMLREVVYCIVTKIFMGLIVVALLVGSPKGNWWIGVNSLFMVICVVMMFVAKDRRTLQDWLAGTVVVKLPEN